MAFIGDTAVIGSVRPDKSLSPCLALVWRVREFWEIRPFDDRIIFAHYKDGVFVLLSHFVKKDNKTPVVEIMKARRLLTDYIERKKRRKNKMAVEEKKKSQFKTWKEVKEEIKSRGSLTPEEWAEIDLKVQILGEIIEAREKKGLTQKELANLSGVKQSYISRFENNKSDAQLLSVLKILRPLGKTLAVVPIKE